MEEPKSPKAEFSLKFILLAILFAGAFFLYHYKRTTATKIPKRELVAKYGVDKKTFSKWIEFFCTDVMAIDQYKKLRKITEWDAEKITRHLGDTDGEIGVMNKSDLANHTDSTYEVMRDMVFLNIHKTSISKEQYSAMSIFPPKISKEIVLLMDGTLPSELESA